ncbi:hypothetical protein DPMN_033811 [Dreissena polymorpha]|uniref:Uncharacterized protein n=1 Tax=Dreissena polymorpha TaxID=45954 RepID=A0A9D4M5K3_DREPO|nr:hypothetical protein DPMN_033811 [Dreissena polymorpha]
MPPYRWHKKQTGTIFELIQDSIKTNALNKCYEYWTIHLTFRVLTRKNVPPSGSHVFQTTIAIFKLVQDIIETNLVTKFHEDWTIDVATIVLTRTMLTPHNARRTKSDHKSLQ